MDVSRQHDLAVDEIERGPRARTRRLMLETATRLMQDGVTPSVSEVAEAAEVSRATAYRYFPSQAALVHAVVDEALGPILTWRGKSDDAAERVSDLFRSAMPRISEFEATFRAALKLSLETSTQTQGQAAEEPRFTRGHRVGLLRDALAPMKGKLPAGETERLAQALSLIFGVETLIVLKDMWGLSEKKAYAVAEWAANALVEAAVADARRGVVQ